MTDDSDSPAPFLSPVVEQAFRFAARAHRDHFRKASDLPYVVHPAAVALILQKAGVDDEDILAAALLHDTVEDTEATIEDVGNEFQERVVRLVSAVTEEKRDSFGRKYSWEERKQSHIRHLQDAEVDVCIIVLADKLHNLCSMLFDLQQGDELWSKFGATQERIEWYHLSIIDAVVRDDSTIRQLASECRRVLQQVVEFGE
jgi:(p)ppGpp synthase/HD superfamily hydrolase